MYEARIRRLAESLTAAGYDAFFAHAPATVEYLFGYSEHFGERFATVAIRADGTVRLIAPALSETQARRAGIQDVRGWRDGENPHALFSELVGDWELRTGIVAVDDELPARQLLEMESLLPAALFKAGGALITGLTSVKSEEELARLQAAATIADDAWDEVVDQLRPGLTERQVADLLYKAMERGGGTPTFAIIAAGANGAEPHHLSDDTPLKEGDVVILDFGCLREGYHSDITRTVAIGHASDEARRVYELVYAAHMAGRNHLRAGVTGASVDAAARSVIAEGGFGEYFFHRLGHGIGTQIHESPNLVNGNDEPIVAGNCFSVEPGIYLAGRFGVRIENIVTATADGCRSFNRDPSPTLVVVGNR